MIQAIAPVVMQKLPAIRLYLSSTGMLTLGIVAQAIGFVVLARWLGSEQFGHLATITAVTNVGAAWCGLGAGEAVRRRVGREPSLYRDLFGHSLILLFVPGAALTVLVSAAMALMLKVAADPVENFAAILLLVASNMVLFTWIGLTEQILLAHREVALANRVNVSWGISRAIAAVVACLGFGVDTVLGWSEWNALAAVLVSATSFLAISRFGAPRWRLLWTELPLGATLSLSGSIAVLRQNADLLALSTVAPPHLVGAYGVARRVISTASVVGASFDRLIYTNLAVAGANGPLATFQLARKYLLYGVGLTGATGAAVFIAAPLAPWLFGHEFTDAVWILRLLCWTLVLTAIQFIAFDALNAAERHRVRLLVGTVVGLAGTGLIIGLSLAWGTTGTFVGVYVTEIAMAVALWSTLVLVSGSSLPPSHHVTASYQQKSHCDTT